MQCFAFLRQNAKTDIFFEITIPHQNLHKFQQGIA